MTNLTPEQMMADVKAHITEYWGEKCPDFEPECVVCQAWKAYETSPLMLAVYMDDAAEHQQTVADVKLLRAACRKADSLLTMLCYPMDDDGSVFTALDAALAATDRPEYREEV